MIKKWPWGEVDEDAYLFTSTHQETDAHKITLFTPIPTVANPTYDIIIPKIFPDTYAVSSTIVGTRVTWVNEQTRLVYILSKGICSSKGRKNWGKEQINVEIKKTISDGDECSSRNERMIREWLGECGEGGLWIWTVEMLLYRGNIWADTWMMN